MTYKWFITYYYITIISISYFLAIINYYELLLTIMSCYN